MKLEILAYVDPGLGALAWQMIVSAVIGALFYLKASRDWVVRTLTRIFRSL